MLLGEQQKIKKRKKHKIQLIFSVILMITLLFSFMMPIYAKEEEKIVYTTEEEAFYQAWIDDMTKNGQLTKDKDKVSEYIKSEVIEIYASGGTTPDTGGDFFSGTIEQIKLNTNTSTIFGIAFNIADEIYKYVTSTIGYLLLIIYWLLQLLDEVTSDRFSPESFLKALTKLIVAVYLVSKFPELFEKFIDATNMLLDSVRDYAISGTNDAISKAAGEGQTYEKIKDLGGSTYRYLKLLARKCTASEGNLRIALGQFTRYLALDYSVLAAPIMSLGSIFISISTFIVCITRMIKIPIWYAMAPLGIAGVVQDGFRGPGFRYMRKLFALLLQGVLITFCLTLYDGLKNIHLHGSVFFDLISPVLIGFAVLAIIKSTEDIADKMLDAR